MLLFNILINSFKSSIAVSCVNLLYPGIPGVFRRPANCSTDPLIHSMCSPVPHTPSPPGSKFSGDAVSLIPANQRVAIVHTPFAAISVRPDDLITNIITIAAAFKIPALRKDFQSTNILANITHSPFPFRGKMGTMAGSSSFFGLNQNNRRSHFDPCG